MNKSEKGFTLLEILISIVILSIMFLSLINFFPQMGFINLENKDKTQAINTAKDLLLQWEHSSTVIDNLKNTVTNIPGYDKTVSGYHYFKTTAGKYNAVVKIKTDTDLQHNTIQTRLIDVQILNKRNNVVGETYGYIILK